MEKNELENWKRCVSEMRELQSLTLTKGKTPIMKIKNQIIEQINHYEKEFSLLTEERKEKNEHIKQMLLDTLKDVCILIDDFYIEEEKEFIKNIFKDGANPTYEEIKPYQYYKNLIK